MPDDAIVGRSSSVKRRRADMSDPSLNPEPSMRTQEPASRLPWVVGILGLLAVVGTGWYLQRPTPQVPALTKPVPIPSQPAETVAPAGPQFPVAPLQQALADQPQDPLPELFDSDGFARNALQQLLAHPQLADWLVSEHLIARFVAFVDALPNRKIGMNLWPLKPASGKFFAQQSGDSIVIGAANGARYDAHVQALVGMDTGAAVTTYRRLYPLFQQAYRELGHADGYFNDRLVAVIDHLLSAPEPAPPVAVILTDKGYAYADANLEAASAGEKFMMRIGPAHAAAVKAKLRELRVALTVPPPSAP
jgi:phosphoglycolate phosphatase-like HAD superfamily hydrolase